MFISKKIKHISFILIIGLKVTAIMICQKAVSRQQFTI